MKNEVELTAEGLPALKELLKKLPESVEEKVTLNALRISARPFIKSAKAKVPVKSGLLKRSLNIRSVGGKGNKSVYAGVSYKRIKALRMEEARNSKTKSKKTYAPHAHLIEYGTSKMAAQPFIRPAWDETQEEVIKSIGNSLGIAITKHLERQAKQIK
jgi:HK97 gp10 family phage protein